MTERIIRFKEVKHRTGKSKSAVYSAITDGTFPSPIKLGARMVGWREKEIDAMIAARIRGVSDDEIRDIVRQLQAERKEVA
jgi:prophage regulatory protein